MNNHEGFFDQLRKQHLSQNASGPVFETEAVVEIEVEMNGRSDDVLPSFQEVLAQNSTDQNQGMQPEAKRALVSLLRQGVILSSQKSKLFDSICRYQTDIRRHLADMYLKLVLDDKTGVAFVASVTEDDTSDSESIVDNDREDESVSLISRRTLSLFDTLLLLVLRKHYQERETSGEQKVVIDIERVESNLMPFLPLTNSSKSDRKKLNAALQKMVERRVLSSVRGSDDRYEITPIIRYVVNAEFLESMLLEYKKLAFDADDLSDQEV
jgi:hypothetical protein